MRAAQKAKAPAPIVCRPEGRSSEPTPVPTKAPDPTVVRREPSASVMVSMESQKAKAASPMLTTEAGMRRALVSRAEVQMHSTGILPATGEHTSWTGQLLKTMMVPSGMVSVPLTP